MKTTREKRLMLMVFHYIVSIIALIFIFIYREQLQELGNLWLYLVITGLLLALAVFEAYRYRKENHS